MSRKAAAAFERALMFAAAMNASAVGAASSAAGGGGALRARVRARSDDDDDSSNDSSDDDREPEPNAGTRRVRARISGEEEPTIGADARSAAQRHAAPAISDSSGEHAVAPTPHVPGAPVVLVISDSSVVISSSDDEGSISSSDWDDDEGSNSSSDSDDDQHAAAGGGGGGGGNGGAAAGGGGGAAAGGGGGEGAPEPTMVVVPCEPLVLPVSNAPIFSDNPPMIWNDTLGIHVMNCYPCRHVRFIDSTGRYQFTPPYGYQRAATAGRFVVLASLTRAWVWELSAELDAATLKAQYKLEGDDRQVTGIDVSADGFVVVVHVHTEYEQHNTDQRVTVFRVGADAPLGSCADPNPEGFPRTAMGFGGKLYRCDDTRISAFLCSEAGVVKQWESPTPPGRVAGIHASPCGLRVALTIGNSRQDRNWGLAIWKWDGTKTCDTSYPKVSFRGDALWRTHPDGRCDLALCPIKFSERENDRIILGHAVAVPAPVVEDSPAPVVEDPPAPVVEDPTRPKCTICGLRSKDAVLPCGHTDCLQCLNEWLGVKRQCHLCRRPALHAIKLSDPRASLIEKIFL